MATTQYKDNAGNIHEFQQEPGDAGGAEKRPITGLPAAVRTQFANMTSALLALAGTVLDGVLKVSLQAGSAVIGKLAPNAGVNIGTVDVASGTFAMGGPIPAGSAHIGNVAVDAALPAGANTIGKVDVNVLPALGQLPGSLGAKTSAASLSVVHSTDHPPQVVNLSGAVPAGTNNIGDVDVATLPALPQLPASLGQKVKTASLSTVLASDQGTLPVSLAALPALAAGNNNIGDVDVASMPPLPAGTNTIGKLGANAGVKIGTVDLSTAVGGDLTSTVSVNGVEVHALHVQITHNGSPVLPLRSEDTVVSDQGVGVVGEAEGWYVKPTDGTRTIAIKAASVAPIATDPALVVAISPNSPQLDTLAAKLDSVIAGQAPPAALYGGRVTVPTAGTRVVLGASQVLTEGVELRGIDTNTGLVYAGNASVTATANGTRLATKERLFIRCNNVNKVYIDAAVNGEGVTWIGW